MEVPALTHRTPPGTLKPGRALPMRAVPERIERPRCTFHNGPERITAPEIESPETIAETREARHTAAGAIEAVGVAIAPGVTTEELGHTGHEFIITHGTYPSYLGYVGFPKSICTSINEVTCHGIPDGRPLEDGDTINVDITTYKNGVYDDTCAIFEVGAVDEESHLPIGRTRDAMMRGVKAADPGREINVIGRATEAYTRRFGYGAVCGYTGHSVGEAFHFGLIIPHYDAAPAYGTVMESGMIFTIEPVSTLGTIEWEQWDND